MTLALVALLVMGQEAEGPPTPGWAKEGGAAGIALAAVPLGLAVGSIVAMWRNDTTAADWLTVGSALSVPLVGLVPTFGGRSAVVAEDQARRPRIFRIIGWVISIYGTVSTLVGLAVGKIASVVLTNDYRSYATSDTGKVVGTVTTALSAAICTTGLMFLSGSSVIAADRAVSPVVAFAPRPGGGWAAFGGVNGRF